MTIETLIADLKKIRNASLECTSAASQLDKIETDILRLIRRVEGNQLDSNVQWKTK